MYATGQGVPKPIYLGVGAAALGFFLMGPGPLTLAVLTAAAIGLPI